MPFGNVEALTTLPRDSNAALVMFCLLDDLSPPVEVRLFGIQLIYMGQKETSGRGGSVNECPANRNYYPKKPRIGHESWKLETSK